MHPLYILLVTSAALAAEPALAQAAAPAAGSGGAGWLWILLVLAVIGVAAWYFLSRRRSTTSHTTGISHDRVEGPAEQMKGLIKEGVGSLIGDTKLQAEGRADKIEGKAQNTVGGIKDTLRGQ